MKINSLNFKIPLSQVKFFIFWRDTFYLRQAAKIFGKCPKNVHRKNVRGLQQSSILRPSETAFFLSDEWLESNSINS